MYLLWVKKKLIIIKIQHGWYLQNYWKQCMNKFTVSLLLYMKTFQHVMMLWFLSDAELLLVNRFLAKISIGKMKCPVPLCSVWQFLTKKSPRRSTPPKWLHLQWSYRELMKTGMLNHNSSLELRNGRMTRKPTKNPHKHLA